MHKIYFITEEDEQIHNINDFNHSRLDNDYAKVKNQKVKLWDFKDVLEYYESQPKQRNIVKINYDNQKEIDKMSYNFFYLENYNENKIEVYDTLGIFVGGDYPKTLLVLDRNGYFKIDNKGIIYIVDVEANDLGKNGKDIYHEIYKTYGLGGIPPCKWSDRIKGGGLTAYHIQPEHAYEIFEEVFGNEVKSKDIIDELRRTYILSYTGLVEKSIKEICGDSEEECF